MLEVSRTPSQVKVSLPPWNRLSLQFRFLRALLSAAELTLKFSLPMNVVIAIISTRLCFFLTIAQQSCGTSTSAGCGSTLQPAHVAERRATWSLPKPSALASEAWNWISLACFLKLG